MNQNQFANALEKGLGRVFDYIEENRDELFRDQLLQACIKNQCYDRQCEESRAEWLISLTSLSKHKDYYSLKIINALSTSKEFYDVYQLYELYYLIAKEGNTAAKLAIYQKFDLQEFNEPNLGGDEIIQMDGLEGLLHIVKVIGKHLIESEDYCEDDLLYCKACELFGKAKTDDFLLQHSKENQYVMAYLNELKKHKERTTPKDSRSHIQRFRDEYPIERILDDIENGKGRYTFRRFGLYATTGEIEKIFSSLISETNKEKLIRYLWIFRNRELPSLPQTIIDLAFSNDHDLQDAAITAVSNLSDPSIREIAITLSSHQDKQIALKAINLFVNNYQQGDSKFIEPMLTNSAEQDTVHWACSDAIKLFEKNPLEELVNTMLWVYENTPCTHCRNWAVRLLIEKGWLPDTQLNECQNDCVKDTRELVKITLNTQPKVPS